MSWSSASSVPLLSECLCGICDSWCCFLLLLLFAFFLTAINDDDVGGGASFSIDCERLDLATNKQVRRQLEQF